MVVTCREMADAEARFFALGYEPEPFMDEAGGRSAEAIRSFLPTPATAVVFVGKGNNGGDALVIARYLKRWGWEVRLRFSHAPESLQGLVAKKWSQFEAEPENAPSAFRPITLIVDGLLGISARGDLKDPVRGCVEELNQLKLATRALCVAVDIPTGFHADRGMPAGAVCVRADVTLSICMPKSGFVCDGAAEYLGRLVEIPLAIPVSGGDTRYRFLFPSLLASRLPHRSFEYHKGLAGRVTIVAGSAGMSGAALLSAMAASRTGAGLVTLCVPETIHSVVASSCPAEIMVRPIKRWSDVYAQRCDAMGVGPGMGMAGDDQSLMETFTQLPQPMVIDADGLNRLARNREALRNLPRERVLTPHPGELARLAPDETGTRAEVAERLAERWGITLLSKGARSLVATPGYPIEFNTSGHYGMASGGMGDILTGVITSFLGQGLASHDAACVGSWLLGRAAEIACIDARSAREAITASEVVDSLGQALNDLQHQYPG